MAGRLTVEARVQPIRLGAQALEIADGGVQLLLDELVHHPQARGLQAVVNDRDVDQEEDQDHGGVPDRQPAA